MSERPGDQEPDDPLQTVIMMLLYTCLEKCQIIYEKSGKRRKQVRTARLTSVRSQIVSHAAHIPGHKRLIGRKHRLRHHEQSRLHIFPAKDLIDP